MGLTSRMGDLERAVVEQLWAAGEGAPDPAWVSVRDVHEALAARRDVAYTTVMTVMDRLSKKRVLERVKDGRAYLYRAVGSRSAMTAGLMRDALAEFADADRRPALVAFVGEASAEERAALREALARLEQRDAAGL